MEDRGRAIDRGLLRESIEEPADHLLSPYRTPSSASSFAGGASPRPSRHQGRAVSVTYSPSPGNRGAEPVFQAVEWLPEYLVCTTREQRRLGLRRLSVYRPRFAHGANAVVHLVETDQEPRTLLVVKEYTTDPEGVFDEATYARGVADGASVYLCRFYGLLKMDIPDPDGRVSRKTVSLMNYMQGRCGEDLRHRFHQMEMSGRIRNADIWQFPMQYVRDLIHLVLFLQQRATVYCDLKPDNVITQRGTGITAAIDVGSMRPRDGFSGPCTFYYGAPEAIPTEDRPEGDRDLPIVVDSRSDLYSIGRMLVVMVENIDLFESEVTYRPSEKWRRSDFNRQKCSEYQEFVDGLSARDPVDRMTPEAAIRHPFLNGGYDEARARAIARRLAE